MPRLLLALLVLGAPGGTAGAADLPRLLDALSANARAPEALRADVTITRGEARSAAVLLAWRDVLYLETADGFRALVRRGKAAIARDGRPVRAPLRTQIPGTDVLVEDLPFAGVPLRFPQIYDEGPDEVVIGGEPAVPSLYVLIVHTVDPVRHVVVATKFYKDDIATLFKLRRNGEYAPQADGHWRPGTIEVEDFSAQSRTRLALEWRPAPDLPRALFSPAALRRPSGLTVPPPR